MDVLKQFLERGDNKWVQISCKCCQFYSSLVTQWNLFEFGENFKNFIISIRKFFSIRSMVQGMCLSQPCEFSYSFTVLIRHLKTLTLVGKGQQQMLNFSPCPVYHLNPSSSKLHDLRKVTARKVLSPGTLTMPTFLQRLNQECSFASLWVLRLLHRG